MPQFGECIFVLLIQLNNIYLHNKPLEILLRESIDILQQSGQ